MGYASYVAYYSDSPKNTYNNGHISMALYITQLALNWAWTPIFFGFHRVKIAFYVIVVLDLFVLATMIQFFRVSYLAGGLLVPYMCWLCIATALNTFIWNHNGDHPEFGADGKLLN